MIKPFICLACLANNQKIFSCYTGYTVNRISEHLKSKAHKLTAENLNAAYLRMEPEFRDLIQPGSVNYVANLGKYVKINQLQTAKYESPPFESELKSLLVAIQLTESN